MFLKRSLCLLSYSIAFAGPEYASTIAGDVSLSQAPQLLEVTASDRSIIEWNRFSIPAEETVRFIQPSSSATVLNRVIGQDLSELFGRLEANGAVYLINPRGFLVGKTGVIDTAAFLASTLDCSNQAFLEGAELSLQGDSEAPLTHLGTIRAKGGDVVLVAHQVDQGGLISAPEGSVSLSASHEILLKPKAFPLLNIRPDRRAFGVSMSGSIEALHASLQSDSLSLHALEYYDGTITLTQEGGKILLSTEGGPIHIQQTAHAKAPAGEIDIRIAPQEGDHKPLYQLGTLDVSGTKGGSIHIEAPKMLHTGHLHANGEEHGGNISVKTLQALIQTRMAKSTANGTKHGGVISLEAGRLFTSGSLEAQGGSGGLIHVFGPDINLIGAKLHATGHKESGGRILVGHRELGSNLQTEKVLISPSTQFHTTGPLQNGTVFIAAMKREKFTQHVGAAVEYPQWPLVDPDAGWATSPQFFGNSVLALSSGTICVGSPLDSFAATAAGAAYLYDALTGDLISMITGSSANDNVPLSNSTGGGFSSLTGNGNYYIRSKNWDNGAATGAGAVTWGNGTTGVWGTVSAANSLVGTSTNDLVGASSTNLHLSNGNYVLVTTTWNLVDGGPLTDVGAITWVNGTTGITGTISVVNSLIGSSASDQVGIGTLFELSNGHYVVRSPYWDRIDGGVATNAGAATWGNGTTGITGTVSVVNSLIGSTASDLVGGSRSMALIGNGNYLVSSTAWSRIEGGAASSVGALTWGNGATGITGTISILNSLIGSTASDSIGSGAPAFPQVARFNDGNALIGSPSWSRVDGGALSDVGAMTWINGTTGITGTVSILNSLIGSTASDRVGNTASLITLSNGHLVYGNKYWSQVEPGAVSAVGAVTWVNGTTGITGTISILNSLIGSTASDNVGSLMAALQTNGNYVVFSRYWDRVDGGAVANVGAATWGDGTTGITGTVSIINSLIGSTTNDNVGRVFGRSLSNGNYVVVSMYWNRVDGGAVSDVGAVTWGNGTTGITGTVSVVNSLIGSTASDVIGNSGIQVVANGNYVVRSYSWKNAGITSAGAATWGNGTMGITGTVSVMNSLVGATTGDEISSTEVLSLANGNYVISSFNYTRPGIGKTGAVTWANGTTGLTGTVSIANSLVGSTATTEIGKFGSLPLPSGNYVAIASSWQATPGQYAGAATWASGASRLTGTITKLNSVLGYAGVYNVGMTARELPTIWDGFVCSANNSGGYVIIAGVPPVSGALAAPAPIPEQPAAPAPAPIAEELAAPAPSEP